ncbi:MAG: hypothetical protein GX606_06790 [Elusimicrobia bacterium]|nr:hypothetical protein [Elusimicrobiota bacterium]
MDLKLKKFLAGEWLMFLVIGCFWAAAMFLPLFLTRALKDPSQALENFLIMWGPYLVYFSARSVMLLIRSVIRAYLVANYFFTSGRQKQLAQEWILLFLLVIVWGCVMAYPLYVADLFDGWVRVLFNTGVVLGPYVAHWLLRLGWMLMGLIAWAVRIIRRPA